jgi:hypothetical protein
MSEKTVVPSIVTAAIAVTPSGARTRRRDVIRPGRGVDDDLAVALPTAHVERADTVRSRVGRRPTRWKRASSKGKRMSPPPSVRLVLGGLHGC